MRTLSESSYPWQDGAADFFRPACRRSRRRSLVRPSPAALTTSVAARGAAAADEWGPEPNHCAVCLRVAPQRQGKGVTVDDSRRRRKQGALRLERRLKSARLEGCKLCDLAVVGRDDRLAAAPIRHAVVPAEGVQHRLALDAEPRLEATSRVVDASVDDLTVARTRPRADRVFSLDDHHLAPCARKRPRDRQAHNPGADHETVDRTR